MNIRNVIFGGVVAPFMLSAAACTTTPVVVDDSKYIIVKPPAALLNCPQLRKMDLPNPDTMTNAQLAELIEKLVKKLQTCGVNMAKIKEYISSVEKIYADRMGN